MPARGIAAAQPRIVAEQHDGADMGRSEILLVGVRPDGLAWRIRLADPLAPERVAVTLDLAFPDAVALVTLPDGSRHELRG